MIFSDINILKLEATVVYRYLNLINSLRRYKSSKQKKTGKKSQARVPKGARL